MSYDPGRYLNVANLGEAAEIILPAIEGMTTAQRWIEETSALFAILEQHIAPGSLVLDYGCGVGRLAKPLIEHLHCSVVGVDISQSMRALAVAYVGSGDFLTVAPEALATLDRTFDAAIAVWTLQHVLDLPAAIRQIADALTDEGALVVINGVQRSVPVAGGLWLNDGLDVHDRILAAGFRPVEMGELDARLAPDCETFWAAYEKGPPG